MPTKRKMTQIGMNRDARPSTSDSQESRLLALPIELRYEICEHLFRSSDSIIIAQGSPPRVHSNLVRVSRQIRRESEYIRRQIEPEMKRVTHFTIKIKDFNCQMIQRLLDFYWPLGHKKISSGKIKLAIAMELTNNFETSLSTLRNPELSGPLRDYYSEYYIYWHPRTFDQRYAREVMRKLFQTKMWPGSDSKFKEKFVRAFQRQDQYEERMRRERASKRRRIG